MLYESVKHTIQEQVQGVGSGPIRTESVSSKVERIGYARSNAIRADVNAKGKCQAVHLKAASDPNRLV